MLSNFTNEKMLDKPVLRFRGEMFFILAETETQYLAQLFGQGGMLGNPIYLDKELINKESSMSNSRREGAKTFLIDFLRRVKLSQDFAFPALERTIIKKLVWDDFCEGPAFLSKVEFFVREIRSAQIVPSYSQLEEKWNALTEFREERVFCDQDISMLIRSIEVLLDERSAG